MFSLLSSTALSQEPHPETQYPDLLRDIADRCQGILDYRYDDFTVEGYAPHPAIAGKVAV